MSYCSLRKSTLAGRGEAVVAVLLIDDEADVLASMGITLEGGARPRPSRPLRKAPHAEPRAGLHLLGILARIDRRVDERDALRPYRLAERALELGQALDHDSLGPEPFGDLGEVGRAEVDAAR